MLPPPSALPGIPPLPLKRSLVSEYEQQTQEQNEINDEIEEIYMKMMI
jgi:hypothetical protein